MVTKQELAPDYGFACTFWLFLDIFLEQNAYLWWPFILHESWFTDTRSWCCVYLSSLFWFALTIFAHTSLFISTVTTWWASTPLAWAVATLLTSTWCFCSNLGFAASFWFCAHTWFCLLSVRLRRGTRVRRLCWSPALGLWLLGHNHGLFLGGEILRPGWGGHWSWSTSSIWCTPTTIWARCIIITIVAWWWISVWSFLSTTWFPWLTGSLLFCVVAYGLGNVLNFPFTIIWHLRRMEAFRLALCNNIRRWNVLGCISTSTWCLIFK